MIQTTKKMFPSIFFLGILISSSSILLSLFDSLFTLKESLRIFGGKSHSHQPGEAEKTKESMKYENGKRKLCLYLCFLKC